VKGNTDWRRCQGAISPGARPLAEHVRFTQQRRRAADRLTDGFAAIPAVDRPPGDPPTRPRLRKQRVL